MPLSPPASRRRKLVDRNILCEGFARDDGLFDIEGQLRDTRGYSQPNEERGTIAAGEPIHEMYLRLTIDSSCVIQAVESVTQASPFQYCQSVTPNMQRLVGLQIVGGFKKRMHQLVGGTSGCTHLVTLLEVMATVAIQTIASSHRFATGQSFIEAFATRGKDRHPLVGTCHSYAPDSPVVRRRFPELAVKLPDFTSE